MTTDGPSQRARKRPQLPFEQGDLVEGEVTRLTAKGGAEAELRGVMVRAPGGVPGDRGVFRVTHVGRNAAWARIHELHTPGQGRVEHDCNIVHRCGGCPWQMVSLDAQRQARQTALEESLTGLTDENTRWLEWTDAKERYGYRTRALMMARHLRGELRLGFYESRTQELVGAEGCAVQHPQLNITLDAARGVIARHSLSTWRSAARPGILRALLLRIDPDQPKGLLTLVVSREPDDQMNRIARELQGLDGITGVWANINTSEGGPVLGPVDLHLAGAIRQRVNFGELELEVGPTAFLQTQHAMANELVARVAALLPERMDHLLDVYSGIGVIGLSVRDRAERVTLIESDEAAVRDARHNIHRLEVENVEIVAGDAAEATLPVLADTPPDAIVLDPPRAGCAPELIDAIGASLGDPRIVLVSCGLKGLTRDVQRLAEAGFRVTDVAPLEMFPHTPHVEVVVGLRRGD